MSLLELKPLDRNSAAKEMLRERFESDERLNLIVIIEQHEDGTRRLFTSPGSHEEKALLKCFFDNWVLDWFRNS